MFLEILDYAKLILYKYYLLFIRLRLYPACCLTSLSILQGIVFKNNYKIFLKTIYVYIFKNNIYIHICGVCRGECNEISIQYDFFLRFKMDDILLFSKDNFFCNKENIF